MRDEVPPQWFVKIVWLAMILCLVLIFMGVARAQDKSLLYKSESADGSPMALRIFDTPCISEQVLAQLKRGVVSALVAHFNKARLTWGGRDWESCWLLYGQSVISIDEEGDLLNPPNGVPISLFTQEGL